jgi:hypothetical protein
MLKKLTKTVIIVSLFIFSFVLLSPVHAASQSFSGTVDITDTQTFECNTNRRDLYSFTVPSDGIYKVEFTSAVFDVTATAVGYIYAEILDTPNYVNYTSLARAYTNRDHTSVHSPSLSLSAGTTYYLYVHDCGYIVANPQYISVDYTVSISSVADSTSSEAVFPPDNRINWQYGDLNAVVYEHEDGVVVYCYDGDASLVMVINQELVDNWDSSLPQDIAVLEVNTDTCRVAFYILDTGEYQINIWDREGKLYEIIADNLNFSNPTMRYHDPNE